MKQLTHGLQVNVKVVAIYVDEEKVKRAEPGENLRVRLSGIEEEDISSGFVLSSVCKFFVCCNLTWFPGNFMFVFEVGLCFEELDDLV